MSSTRITYLGQAGYILESEIGTKIGIDLYLSDCVEREDGLKRLMPHIVSAEDLELDYVIATHYHHDHFDIDAMPVLMNHENTILLTALDGKEYVDKLFIDKQRVVYLKEGDGYQAKDVHIEAVECDHGPQTPFAIGLVITIDGKRIYVTGDTCLHTEYAEEILKKGKVDYLIAPINGAFGNMNEEEAVELCMSVRPHIAIPSHYWCFAEHGGNPGKFVGYIREKFPEQKYMIMAMGETSVI